ncbi:transposase [Nocardia panacis]
MNFESHPKARRVGHFVNRHDGDQYRVLTNKQWELVELLLPKSDGRVGRNFINNCLVVEGMLFRLRTGVPWRDLPEVFGPWKTVWKRHHRYADDGTWDRVLVALTALADATGNLNWVLSTDSPARTSMTRMRALDPGCTRPNGESRVGRT